MGMWANHDRTPEHGKYRKRTAKQTHGRRTADNTRWQRAHGKSTMRQRDTDTQNGATTSIAIFTTKLN